jgi:phospholipase A1
VLLLWAVAGPAQGDDAARQRCLMQALEQASDETTVAELRTLCAPEPAAAPSETAAESGVDSLIERRKQAELATRNNPFVLIPHKSNYVLLASYNDTPNSDPYALDQEGFDRLEMKFQLSFKFPVVEDLFGTRADLYFAYTSLSFWQAYNRSDSSPFRETNHEPEVFALFENDWRFLGWKNSLVQIGLSHQSNGKSDALSRSWNRLYAQLVFERDQLFLALKPWYRLPEDAADDDNPDILDYMGHGEVWLGYKSGPQTYSMMLRNELLGGGKGAVQLDWSFPMYGRFRGYLQYFNGYGESLIDYDAYTHRLGIGIELNETL